MRRFFITPGSLQGRRIVFTGKDAHYMRKVLRVKRGESICAFDGQGVEYSATVGIISPRRVEAIISGVERKGPVRAYRVALAQAVVKGSGLDLVVRQASEVGISEFFPLITRHCMGKMGRSLERKGERWEKIATAATRQSGQNFTPRIHPLLRWKEFLPLCSQYDLCLLPWEKEQEKRLKTVLKKCSLSSPPGKIMILIGPEGGFSESEVAEAIAAGFQPVSLGPATLRAITAGVVAVSNVHYHCQKG